MDYNDIINFFNEFAPAEMTHNACVTLAICHKIIMLKYADVRGGHLLLSNMARLPAAAAGEHDGQLSVATDRVAAGNVETWCFLQERQKSYVPGHHHPQSLHLALPGQEDSLHGQVRDKASLITFSFNSDVLTEIQSVLFSRKSFFFFFKLKGRIDFTVKKYLMWSVT